MRIRIVPAAKAELDEAAVFYNNRKPGLELDFLDEVGRTLAYIKEFPNAAAVIRKAARQRRVERFPYGLVYIARDSEIIVIAVAHLKRKPGYWRNRLKDPGSTADK